LDDLSKVHIQDYVKHIQKKNKLEKLREEASAKRSKIFIGNILTLLVEKEQEMTIGDVKYKDIMQSQYIKSVFLDPKKNIIQGSLASDPRKKFIYLSQKNDQCKLYLCIMIINEFKTILKL